MRSEAPLITDAPSPLRPLLDFAVDQIARLSTVEVGGQAEPVLDMLLHNHGVHAAELARLIGVAVPEGDATVDADPVAELLELEKDGMEQAVEACVAADATYATLLGEIAACRATHADALEAVHGG